MPLPANLSQRLLPSLFLSVAFAAPLQARAIPLIGDGLGSFSVLAGTAVTIGANSTISALTGGSTAVTLGAGAVTNGVIAPLVADPANNVSVGPDPRVTSAVSQIKAAKDALTQLGAGTVLAATMAEDLALAPGLYSTAGAWDPAAYTTLTLDGGGLDNQIWIFNIGSAVTTGVDMNVVIANAGPGAAVFWNIGTALTFGAGSSMIGTILAAGAVSEGLYAQIPCGSVYSLAAITISAQSIVQSSDCLGNSVANVNAMGLSIAESVPEPKTFAMALAGLGILGLKLRSRKRRA